MITWAVAPDDGPAISYFEAIVRFWLRSHQLYFKQPRGPVIMVAGSVDFDPHGLYLCSPTFYEQEASSRNCRNGRGEKPAKVIRIDDVSASVFAREHTVQRTNSKCSTAFRSRDPIRIRAARGDMRNRSIWKTWGKL